MISVTSGAATGDHASFSLEATGSEPVELTFSSPSLQLEPCGDAALVASLPLAMAAGQPLQIDLPVSPRLRAALPNIQDLLAGFWRSTMTRVDVTAPPGDPRPRGTTHGGAFSSDIDSVHLTLAADRPDLLIAVDADLPASLAAGPVGPRGDGALVSTNLAEIGTRFGLGWHDRYRGAALAAVAHMIPDLGRYDLPAPFSVNYLFAWGSHVLLDPLWSGDGLDVRHRHGETDWIDRLGLVAADPDSLDLVRACDDDAPAPCGVCRGCLFLQAGLQVVGHATGAVDLDALRALDLRHHAALADTAVLLRHADRSTDAELVQALEAAVRRLSPGDVQWPDNWSVHVAELGLAHR